MKCCSSASHHECCKEWAGPGFIIGSLVFLSIFFPSTFGLVIAAITTPIGMSAIMALTTGLALRKSQVRSWEIDRPFSDGIDETPDPYLFSPGPGATWGLRAFMPDVETYSFWRQPISWCVKQAKRKVAILLDDGTVSFTWFPVAWISEAAGRGSRIMVPEGWKITAHQAKVLQVKRDAIKNIVDRYRSEYQRDFMAFTDLVFAKNAQIGVEPVLVEYPCLAESDSTVDRLAEVVEKMAGEVATKVDVGVLVDIGKIKTELAEWREKRPVKLGRHQKALLEHNKRITDLEMACGVNTARKPENPPSKP